MRKLRKLLFVLLFALACHTTLTLHASTVNNDYFVTLGAQMSEITEEKTAVRLIVGLGGENLENVSLEKGFGFKIEVLDADNSVVKTKEINCSSLLTKVTAAKNGVNMEVTAESIHSTYLYALTITNTPAGTKLKVTPYVTTTNDEVVYDTTRVVTVPTEGTTVSVEKLELSIKDKNDFVKMPGEKINNENFTSLAQNVKGNATYTFVKKSGLGELTDNGNGTFNFDPQVAFGGEVVITFTVTDDYQTVSKDITLTYKTVNPEIFDGNKGDKVVNKKGISDLVMTIHTYGKENSSLYYPVVDILLNGESIGEENFGSTNEDRKTYFDLKASYLETLDCGDYEFTVKTLCGEDTFWVTVVDTREVEVNGENNVLYNKDEDTADLSFTLTLYENVVNEDSFTIDVKNVVATNIFSLINADLLLKV